MQHGIGHTGADERSHISLARRIEAPDNAADNKAYCEKEVVRVRPQFLAR
jgi:hypothetical protein